MPQNLAGGVVPASAAADRQRSRTSLTDVSSRVASSAGLFS
ncbi:hypothetical protein [Streptomyces sp. WG5]